MVSGNQKIAWVHKHAFVVNYEGTNPIGPGCSPSSLDSWLLCIIYGYPKQITDFCVCSPRCEMGGIIVSTVQRGSEGEWMQQVLRSARAAEYSVNISYHYHHDHSHVDVTVHSL
jgi:hypothetical protein